MAVTGNEPLSTGDLLAVMQAAQTGAFSRCATLSVKKQGMTAIGAQGVTSTSNSFTLPDGVYEVTINIPGSGIGPMTINGVDLYTGTYFLCGGTYTVSNAFDDDRSGYISIVQVGGGGGQLLASLLAAMGGGAA